MGYLSPNISSPGFWPEEKFAYRVAFAEAFRQWGIYPDGVRGMAESELRYPRLDDPTASAPGSTVYHQENTRPIFEKLSLYWGLDGDRERIYEKMKKNAKIIHDWLTGSSMRDQLSAFGLTVDKKVPRSVFRGQDGIPALEVHSVRVARRRGFRDSVVTDLVVEVRQRRRGFLDKKRQEDADAGRLYNEAMKKFDFRFRRGCTLIIDPVAQRVRYAIATRGNVASDNELDRVRRFLSGESEQVDNPFFPPPCGAELDDEHFAALHRRNGSKPDF